jgi:acetyl esterase
MKIIKIIILSVLTMSLVLAGYIYSLTFNPEGRMDWGQAMFLKLVGNNDSQIAALKKMSIQERSHFADGVPININGFKIDTLTITKDSLKIFIYRQSNLPENSPVIVYYHGGAFLLPWHNVSVTYATLLAQTFNAIVVGIDYRVAPEYSFPIPNNDCYAALEWTIQQIQQWGGDSTQIMLAGESAGATLATTVAIRAKKENLIQLKYQLLDCPVSYIPLNTEAYKKFKNGYFLEENEMLYGVESYLPNVSDYTNKQAMPFYEDSIIDIAPAIVITCEFDPLRDTGRDYAKKLTDANIPTKHIEMKGMLHCMPGPFNEKDRFKLYSALAKEINLGQ